METRGEIVAGAAEGGEFVSVRAGGAAGVGDAPMDALGSTWKDGTMLGGGVADGDHCIEALALEFGNGFRAMRGDIDPDFAHGFDSKRTDADGSGPGAVDFKRVAAEMPQEALGHLAANGIAGAEDEDATLGHREIAELGAAGRAAACCI